MDLAPLRAWFGPTARHLAKGMAWFATFIPSPLVRLTLAGELRADSSQPPPERRIRPALHRKRRSPSRDRSAPGPRRLQAGEA